MMSTVSLPTQNDLKNPPLPRSFWLLSALGFALYMLLLELEEFGSLRAGLLTRKGSDLHVQVREWGTDGWVPPEHFVLLVVARYAEDVMWVIEDTPDTLAVLLVNKGGPDVPPLPDGLCGRRIMCVDTPNVGRESETYLSAMLRTVLWVEPTRGGGDEKWIMPPQAIPDMVVFSQGNGVQHSPNFYSWLRDLMELTEKQLTFPLPGYIGMADNRVEDPFRDHVHYLSAFWTTFNLTLGYMPRPIEFVAGASFAMSRNHIETLGSRSMLQPETDHPLLVGRPFVEDLLARLLEAEGTVHPNCFFVNDHKQPCGCLNPFSGYAFERLWSYL